MRLALVEVLVVDDNWRMRAILVAMLRAFGVGKISEAEDGYAALAQLEVSRADVIVTDLAMRPLDGIQLVQALRTSNSTTLAMTPVIMLTGHSTGSQVALARDAGVTEFLTKPVTARALFERLSAVVHSPRSFVKTATYFGPDRRRRLDPTQAGMRRRASD